MKKKYDIGVGVAFLALSIFAYWEVHDLQPVIPSGKYGPDIFPKLVSVGMGICALVVLIQGLFMKAETNVKILDFLSPGIKRSMKLTGIIILFILLMYFLGFFPAAVIMTAATVALLGERRPLIIAGITASIITGVFIVFRLLLQVNLPQGILF